MNINLWEQHYNKKGANGHKIEKVRKYVTVIIISYAAVTSKPGGYTRNEILHTRARLGISPTYTYDHMEIGPNVNIYMVKYSSYLK